MNFASDNCSGVSPPIMAAIVAANAGTAVSYGGDDISLSFDRKFSALFGHDCRVFPVATGTAANVLALSLFTPPFGAIYCHKGAHILTDECNAPEFYTGGAKLVGLDGPQGKIAPETLDAALNDGGAGVQHHAQPAAVSISQLTEGGAAYTPSEVAALSAICRRHKVALHMDGARLANAIVHLGCSPADITWRAGVDALSFGATKNGAMAAEAVVLFSSDKASEMPYRRKRGGHLFSKMRFLSAQIDAYLANDHWLENARHANAMATRLANALSALPGFGIDGSVDGNEVFCFMPVAVMDKLWAAGFQFHRWDDDTGRPRVRLVTSFATTADDVDQFSSAARLAHA